MKFNLVSTRNVARIMDAAKALEKRLSDEEIMGMGLVYGRPGLGKTMAMTSYHARSSKNGRGVRTVLVRALGIWTESSMLKALLKALGHSPRAYRKDVMFDQLSDALQSEPAIILIDEIDAIAESRKLIGLLKDLHDMTGSAILMVGEERVDGLLRRFESFYNRMNRGGLVHLTGHSAEDVRLVIEQRCEYEIEPAVCAEIYATVGGKSMRSVIDQIRDMEAFARANGLSRITLTDYRKMMTRAGMRPAVGAGLAPPEGAASGAPTSGRSSVRAGHLAEVANG